MTRPHLTEADIRRIVREEIAANDAERRTPEAREERIRKTISAMAEACRRVEERRR